MSLFEVSNKLDFCHAKLDAKKPPFLKNIAWITFIGTTILAAIALSELSHGQSSFYNPGFLCITSQVSFCVVMRDMMQYFERWIDNE